jgi:predicted ester cyclase
MNSRLLLNMSDDNKLIAEQYLRAWLDPRASQRNPGWEDAFIHSEYVDYGYNAAANRPRSSARGPEVARNRGGISDACPDCEVAIERMLADRDLVAVHVTLHGTHSAGPLLGVTATGAALRCEATLICRVKDGQVYEQWGGFDILGLSHQLGLMSAYDPPHRGHRPQLEMGATPREVVRQYWEVSFNERRLAQLDDAETRMLGVFPDCRVRVDDVFAEADLVCSRISSRGTHRGSWLGAPATGKTISFEGVFIWQLADGQLAGRWGSLDRLWMAQQLELVSCSIAGIAA